MKRYLKIVMIVVLISFICVELYEIISSKDTYQYNHHQAIRLFTAFAIAVLFGFDVFEKKKH
jgi:dolichyl-phosphate-mannose--protein O-mannosyl transferase